MFNQASVEAQTQKIEAFYIVFYRELPAYRN